MFKKPDEIETGMIDQIWDDIDEATAQTRRPVSNKTSNHGSFNMKSYKNERDPLMAMMHGTMRPEEAGTSMKRMIGMAQRELSKQMG